jgi:hypothetical protein
MQALGSEYLRSCYYKNQSAPFWLEVLKKKAKYQWKALKLFWDSNYKDAHASTILSKYGLA